MPNVYIIAGPNGAGKTTFARDFLPKYADCPNFINADLIAQGLSPFVPEMAALRAGRLMIGEIQAMAKRGVHFGFETTLSGRGHVPLIRHLKDQGCIVNIYFLWVPKVDVTLSRIKERVSKGGHDIAENDVHRRFERTITNFLVHYRPLADSWILFDNSTKPPSIIALEKEGRLRIIDKEAYTALVNRYEQNK